MNKPLDRQPMYIQELFTTLRSNDTNTEFFTVILDKVLKQPFTITKMYNKHIHTLCNNRNYKSLQRGTQYIVFEYNEDNIIESVYVGSKDNKKNKGMNTTGFFYDRTSTRDYRIYPRTTFYMITV